MPAPVTGSSRALVPGLPTAYPLGDLLPALYQSDAFSQRFTAALDVVLAPVLASLDNLPAYIDPGLAPEDFLTWLGAWVGVNVDGTWPLERRRAVVAAASRLHRKRGTTAGLVAYLELVTAGEVAIEESGGTAWSTTTGAALPGTREGSLLVRVSVDAPAEIDLSWLDAVVHGVKPAHVVHRVEVVGRD